MWWWHWLVHWSGSDYGFAYGRFIPYDFLSGSGSDLGELTLLGGLLAVYRKHNCHSRWCPRLAHHDLTDSATGLTLRLCRVHHPAHPGRRPLTRHHIARIHERNRAGQEAGHGTES